MLLNKQIDIPWLMRVERGALVRLGEHLNEAGLKHVLVITSDGLPEDILSRARSGLAENGVQLTAEWAIKDATYEQATSLYSHVPFDTEVIVAVGGGKCIDMAKYVGFLGQWPVFAAPTSLSNDGFCSPQSSLRMQGQRRSLPSMIPSAVVIDTETCLAAPDILWASGVGDLVAKLTAVEDWRIAARTDGAVVHDFAALLCQTSVLQFMARPKRDEKGVRLLGSAFAVTGVAMEICGSSRPESGSEHLISHALDGGASARPRLHGLQVGVATYVVSMLQKKHTEEIAYVLDATGFWEVVEHDPFRRDEWLEAVRVAPSVKRNFCTVLSTRDCVNEVERYLHDDERLVRCFVN